MTRSAAVLGHPITHSLSPVLHRAAYRSLGLDWTYEAIDVDEPQFAGFLAHLDDSWAGLSLTMPLKREVLTFLDERSANVVATGAANTVVFDRSGSDVRLVGENTDIRGIEVALGEPGMPLADLAHGGGDAVVLGAGATAASALAALADAGFAEVHVVVRSLARSTAVQAAASALGVRAHFHLTGEFLPTVEGAGVLISTLPGGAADGFARELASAGVRVRTDAPLLDVAYDRRPSDLGRAWQGAGGTYVSGERMLLHQAVEQVALFTGQRPDVAVMDAALREAIGVR
ncbi:shikimate dehydrogenase [Rarobacter faecitabidus]|uniref:Shikimate dehydrogenase n=1 Tax=Rarobacter faecitabidus TaxID=13243 RepID=A0A542ZVY5_RARFA|nr:shikimate dehydrogenase [Rarobacter faecitabidus]TQL64469.1 shikimate dehydrogenase [Rarobacter faecitabidus]